MTAWWMFFLSLMWQQPTADIHVTVKNPEGRGNVLVYLYDENSAEDFPKKPWKTIVVPVTGNEMEVVFENIPYGTYAVTVVDDANANGKLDFYFFGPPREKVLASLYAKGRFGPPDFEDAAFRVASPQVFVELDFDNR